MKITHLCGGALAVSLLIGGFARANDDVRLASNYDEAQAVPAPITVSYAKEKPTCKAEVSAASGGCGDCGQCPSPDVYGGSLFTRIGRFFGSSDELPCSTPCPRFGGYGLSGFDSWGGISSGSLPNNNGIINGFNLGGALPFLDEYGIGGQFGMNYGVYNFSGNLSGLSSASQSSEATQQVFITTGLFRHADAEHRFSWGLVHDWMVSNNLGVYGSSPTLAQFRGQVAWATNAWNQIGIWSTIEDRYVTRATGASSDFTGLPYGPVSYQAIDQGSIFWDHQFGEWGAVGRFYAGVPLNKRLAQTPTPLSPNGGFGDTLGSFIIGTNWTVPISKRLSLYANGMYMKPSANAGFAPQGGGLFSVARVQEFWNVGFGLMYSPEGNLRSKTIAGRTWMPYLPVANNGSFLIDSSVTH